MRNQSASVLARQAAVAADRTAATADRVAQLRAVAPNAPEATIKYLAVHCGTNPSFGHIIALAQSIAAPTPAAGPVEKVARLVSLPGATSDDGRALTLIWRLYTAPRGTSPDRPIWEVQSFGDEHAAREFCQKNGIEIISTEWR